MQRDYDLLTCHAMPSNAKLSANEVDDSRLGYWTTASLTFSSIIFNEGGKVGGGRGDYARNISPSILPQHPTEGRQPWLNLLGG